MVLFCIGHYTQKRRKIKYLAQNSRKMIVSRKKIWYNVPYYDTLYAKKKKIQYLFVKKTVFFGKKVSCRAENGRRR